MRTFLVNGVLCLLVEVTSKSQALDFPNISGLVDTAVWKYDQKVLDIENAKCVQQLRMFLNNLINTTNDGMWALRMIDATGKLPTGLLDLNLAWLGDFDECLNIKSPLTNVRGQYCLIIVSANDVNNYLKQSEVQISYSRSQLLKDDEKRSVAYLPSIGTCVPDACTETDVGTILTSLISVIPWNVLCQTEETQHQKLTAGAIATLSFFVVTVLLMILSTIFDSYNGTDFLIRPSCSCLSVPSFIAELHPTIKAFSMNTNGKRLFQKRNAGGEFSCLNGIRVLSMMWVILFHVFYQTLIGPVANMKDISGFVVSWKSLLFANASFSVDSFFVVTGLLVMYNFMKGQKKGETFSLLQFYLHRYLRLTPPIVPIMLICMYLPDLLGSGPYHPELDDVIGAPCRHNWYSLVLHIQNYLFEFEDVCLSHTWYVDVDWQLYLLSPIFLLLLNKYSKISIAILITALAGSTIFNFCLSISKQLPSTNINGDITSYLKYYYFATHTRVAPWIIGALLGFILGKLRLRKDPVSIKIPKIIVGILWLAAVGTFSACVFAGCEAQTSDTYHELSNAFFNSFARPAWSVSLGWTIFASCTGYGGIINSILSLPIFTIINKFSYSIYLLHLPMLFFITYSLKQPRYFTIFNMIYQFPGIFVLAFALSIFWVLAFEMPVLELEKFFKQKKKRKPEPPKEVPIAAAEENP